MGILSFADFISISLILFFLWVIYDWLYLKYSTKNGLKPLPGPVGVPILGSVPFLGKAPWVTFVSMKNDYGEIFQLKLGKRRVIILNSYAAIKDALNKPEFAGRPDLATLAILKTGSNRSAFAMRTGDEFWRFARKTSMRALNLFGSSKNSRLESVVTQACDYLHDALEKTDGQPTNPKLLIADCIGVIGISVIYGSDVDKFDPLIRMIASNAKRLQQFVKFGGATDFVHGGSFFSRNMIKNLIKDVVQPLVDYTAKRISDHKVNEDGTIEDVQDALAVAAKETPIEILQQLGSHEQEIRQFAQNIFAAALGTTTDSIRWIFNLLAANPDVQAKIHAEIVEHCGDQKITCEHMTELVYTRAFITEMYRYVSLVPLALPHSTMKETELWGYYIPENCIVMANLYGHHYNPEVFKNPSQFRPDRFIDQQSGEFDQTMAEKVIVFSLGKRRCIGETMARQEIFLILTRLVQAFQIKPKPGESIDTSQSSPGLTRGPLGHDLIFVKRL